jgi:hypothetical protein
MAFPALSAAPTGCQMEFIDDTIRSPFEAGYTQTRPRFTRHTRKFAVKYIMDSTDLAAINAHADTVRGSVIFSWSHPVTAVAYNVRYKEQPKSEPILNSKGALHAVEFSLEEA